MAAILKNGVPSLVSILPSGGERVGPSGLYCGEDLAAWDACYINPADGLVYRSNGSAAAPAAKVRGYAATRCYFAQNDAVTLYTGVDVAYGSGLTPGTDVYLSGTVPGGLDTAASTGGTAAIGFTVSDKVIRLRQSNY